MEKLQAQSTINVKPVDQHMLKYMQKDPVTIDLWAPPIDRTLSEPRINK